MVLAFPTAVFAQSLDELAGGGGQPTSQSDDIGAYGSGEDDAISAYMRGREPVTGDNMRKAATIASPIVNALGTIAGGIIMVTMAAVFAVTAADLAYIGVPPLRTVLNPAYSAGGATGGTGGMGMGMGGGYGMRGGYGMQGGMAGGQQGATRGICWVSDEAKWCVGLANGNGASPAGGMAGGMGMGMGMQGGMAGGAQQAPPMKSVIFAYFKKRMFFIILFAVCTVVLMSSVLTDCGLNLAALVLKIVSRFSSQASTVQF